jgi:hypothetical protein
MNKLALILAAATIGMGPVLAADAPATNAPASPDRTAPREIPDLYPYMGFSVFHLTPEDSPLAGGASLMDAEYYRLLLWAFDKAFDRDVVIRAVVLPSFLPEYAMGIRASDASKGPVRHTVFAIRPRIQYWAYIDPAASERGDVKLLDGDTLNKIYAGQGWKLPADPKEVPIDRCEKPIDASLAKRIENIWSAVLLETRYLLPGEEGGFVPNDGTTYHFSAGNGFPTLAGQTLATGLAESAPESLIKLAESLVAYCDGKATEAGLSAQADALTKKLKP